MACTPHNTTLTLRRIRSSVTGDAIGREVDSSDNLLCAGSLMQERYPKFMQIYLSSQGYKRLLMEIETLKKYIEIGYGNRWFVRTEIEEENGTEREFRGIIKPFNLKSIYLRIWLGKKVFIIDSREGIKITSKNRKSIKVLIGFMGCNSKQGAI